VCTKVCKAIDPRSRNRAFWFLSDPENHADRSRRSTSPNSRVPPAERSRTRADQRGSEMAAVPIRFLSVVLSRAFVVIPARSADSRFGWNQARVRRFSDLATRQSTSSDTASCRSFRLRRFGRQKARRRVRRSRPTAQIPSAASLRLLSRHESRVRPLGTQRPRES
jgi:hypothetical protein